MSSIIPYMLPETGTPARRGSIDLAKARAQILRHIRREGECWIWTGASSSDGDGYGNVGHNGVTYMSHRLAYEAWVGPIPQGLQVDHLCKRPACVNPAHLEPVTQLENMRRRYATYNYCAQGHEYTASNTYTRPGTRHRDCRACIRDRARRYSAKRRGRAA